MTVAFIQRESGRPGPSVIIIGIDSQIGAALFERLSSQSNKSVFGTTRRKERNQKSDRIFYLDLGNSDSFIDKGFRFDHVVLCAGIASIAGCESDVNLCRQINVEATSKIIQYFSDCGSHIIFISGTAVFDGSQPFFRVNTSTNPINNYGKFKAEVENRFRNDPNVAILRLTKVITTSTPFIRKWLDELDRGVQITVFEDRFVSPIGLSEVLDNIELLVFRRASGIYHFGGATEVSYSDFATSFFADNPKALGLLKKERGPNGSSPIYGSLATHLPTAEPINYSESSIVFSDHEGQELVNEIQKIIDKYFSEEESKYLQLPVETYRNIIKSAQDHLNSQDYARKICDRCVKAIRSYLKEERFFVQSNLYLRATRPTVRQDTESIGWHRETHYGPNLEKSVNVWTPIRGVSEQNTLRFIPNSQLIPESDIFIYQTNDPITKKGSVGHELGFQYLPKNIVGGVDLRNSKPMRVPEFNSALFSGLLIHGSAQNLSENIRFSVDFRILPFSAYDSETAKAFHFASKQPYFELY